MAAVQMSGECFVNMGLGDSVGLTVAFCRMSPSVKTGSSSLSGGGGGRLGMPRRGSGGGAAPCGGSHGATVPSPSSSVAAVWYGDNGSGRS